MPFTPPAGYTSVGQTGYQSVLQIGTTASPPVYSSLLELKSFTIDGFSMTELDLTHLLSPGNAQEFAPSQLRPGKISGNGNLVGDATQLSIVTNAQAKTTFPFKAIIPVQQSAKTLTITGNGYFTAFKLGPFENAGVEQYSFEIQQTGSVSYVVA